MAGNHFNLDFRAFREALRNLPEELVDDGTGIVAEAATTACAEIIAAYPKVTGNLKGHVRVERLSSSRFGMGMIVKSAAKHAWIYENGTCARHTDLGASRGMAPAHHVFIPICIRKRARMNDQLAAMLRREGLLVTQTEE